MADMTWKKWAAAGLMAAAAAGLLAGCGSSTKAVSSASVPQKIVVGLDDSFPPMGFKDESGNLVGFDIDLARAVAKEAGVQVEFKPIDWNSKEAELSSGRIDCLWNGLTITDERKQKIDFSQPYMNNDQIIVTMKDSAVSSKEDLSGKIVGTQEGSSSVDALNKMPELKKSFKELKLYGDFTSALMDLQAGRLDAVVIDSVVGRYYMTKKPDVFKELPGKLATEQFGVGVKKGNEPLLNLINQGLDKVRKDGTGAQISQKWFGMNVMN
jgi:polar amino acid transport system substrate-binding protein